MDSPVSSPVSSAEVVQERSQEVLAAFSVDAAQGLDGQQVKRQREK